MSPSGRTMTSFNSAFSKERTSELSSFTFDLLISRSSFLTSVATSACVAFVQPSGLGVLIPYCGWGVRRRPCVALDTDVCERNPCHVRGCLSILRLLVLTTAPSCSCSLFVVRPCLPLRVAGLSNAAWRWGSDCPSFRESSHSWNPRFR